MNEEILLKIILFEEAEKMFIKKGQKTQKRLLFVVLDNTGRNDTLVRK